MTSPPWPPQEAGAISAHQALFPLPCVAAEPITSYRGSGIRSGQWGKLLRSRPCLCPPRDSTESTVVPGRAPCQPCSLQAPQPLCKGNSEPEAVGAGPACLCYPICTDKGLGRAAHSQMVWGSAGPLISGLCLWLLFCYENYNF